MKKSILTGLFVAALALAVGLTACGPKQAEPAPVAPPVPPPAAEKAPEPESAAPVAGAPVAGGALSAQTLVGTKWKAEQWQFSFQPDGKLKVNDMIDGTWSIEGNKLKLGALGESFEAEIRGSTIIFQGNEVERLQ